MRLLAFACALSGVFGDDMSIVRERVRSRLWPAADDLPSIVANARQLSQSLNATCFWPDIDYAQQDRANWAAITHLQRVSVFTAAVTTPGSPAFEDAALSTALHCALGVWIFRKPAFSNPNWWYKWIGIELDLQSMFLLLGSNRTSAAEQAALVSFSYDSAWWVDDWGGGDNLSDMLDVQLYRGLASSNTTAVAQAFSVLWADAVVGNVTAGWEGVNVGWEEEEEEMWRRGYKASERQSTSTFKRGG